MSAMSSEMKIAQICISHIRYLTLSIRDSQSLNEKSVSSRIPAFRRHRILRSSEAQVSIAFQIQIRVTSLRAILFYLHFWLWLFLNVREVLFIDSLFAFKITYSWVKSASQQFSMQNIEMSHLRWNFSSILTQCIFHRAFLCAIL